MNSEDPAEAVELVSRVFRPHRLQLQGRAASLNMDMQHLQCGLLNISGLQYGADVDIVPGPLERFYLLQIPLRGKAHIESGPHAFVSDIACASLLSPTPDLRMRWHHDNEQLCLRIDAGMVERFLTVWFGRPPAQLPTFDPCVHWQQHPALLQTLQQMIDLALPQTPDAPEQAGTSASMVQLQYALLVHLLNHQAHDLRDQDIPSCPPLAPHSVRRVEDYLVSHCDQALTPESLADMAGVSVRSLFLGFERYRGITPMRLLKQIRLERVRKDLLQATYPTRVADVAKRWGLTHTGRFSQEYAQAFGEPPSATLQAAWARAPVHRGG